MRSAALVAALALTPACTSLPPLSPFDTEGYRPERSLDLSFGVREFADDEDWPEIEEQPVLGLELWWHAPGASLGWELGFNYSEDEDDGDPPAADAEGGMAELWGGLRRTFQPIGGKFHPYVGGGFSLLYAEQEIQNFGLPRSDDDDLGVGMYVHGGLRAELYEGVYVGLDLRVLAEAWSEHGLDDLDYGQAAVTLGSLF